MVSTGKNFEAMSELMSAIKQIDRIIEQEQDAVLDNVLMAVKDINIDCFDKDIKLNIAEKFREGLLKMYKDQVQYANKAIGLDTNFENSDSTSVSGMSVPDPATILKEYTEGKVYTSINIKS
jgi:hypothetical protein